MAQKDIGCDISVRVGGEAGRGMKVISSLLGKVFIREGWWVFIHQDIMSRIRGGHNFTQIRLSTRPVKCPSAQVDILVCLDQTTLALYRDSVTGIIIYDPKQSGQDPPSGDRFLPIPLEDTAKTVGGDVRMANSVASGAVMAVLGLKPEPLYNLLGEIFAEKGDKVVEANKKCAQAGYNRAQKAKGIVACDVPPRDKASKQRMLLTGSEAMALGALASNLRFYSAYPMSPATPIMEYLAAKQKEFGLVVEQAEDEIAAINMAIGASFAGARAMTGTSGGGLALMVEGISLAGMTETPVVIIDCQRPAPATGLPTRTEQADLFFALHAGHGEFPRAILAPATAEESFFAVNRAFYLAEKYQSPVIVLGDQYLNDSAWTTEEFELEKLIDGRTSLLSEADLKKLAPYQYKRYEVTPSGITPRIFPGTPGQVLYADSDEHTEEGHITESAEVRRNMVEKRLKKLSGLAKEMARPRIYPGTKANAYLVSWGSTLGAVAEAVDTLRKDGASIGYIHFNEVFPLRSKPIPDKILDGAKLVAVENNATGQLARLLRMETGVDIEDRILKYDGRPFVPQELTERLQKILR
jgi:2-oxoglutarate ferredoxin oxidoreductase subunit alpha